MKDERIIHHKPALQLIRKISSPKRGELKAKIFKGGVVNGKLRFTDNWFRTSFTTNNVSIHRNLFGKQKSNVQFCMANREFVLSDFFVGNASPPAYTATTSEVFTRGFSKRKNYFYRLIIPVTKELRFHFQLDETLYTTDLGYRSRLGVTATIDGENLLICNFHDDKKQYYVSIDSSVPQSYESFSDKAHAFLVALGFVTGHLAGNRGYFFVYDKREMKEPIQFLTKSLRPEIITGTTPVNWNPFAYIRNRKLAEKYYHSKTLSPVSSAVLSDIAQKAMHSLDFQSALILILESGKASLLFRPGGYAIALETLSDLIIEKHVEKLSPIKDKQLSKTIRKQCTDVIKQYEEVIQPDDIKTLLVRIEQLNQMTNKARLKAPFGLLNIELLPEDHQILLTRNDFLHGRIPDLTDAGEDRPLDRKNNDLYYASQRLFTLLSMLILKWCGYEGYVLNHAQLQASFCKIPLQELPYRKP